MTKQFGSNLRTFPLRLTGLRQDGYNNWDIPVLKDFMLTEKVAFQLRAEATDALNHAMFGHAQYLSDQHAVWAGDEHHRGRRAGNRAQCEGDVLIW